jgi:hypothetical protein
MGLVISKGLTLRKGWQPMDTDAAAYITAVETADGQALEEKTKIAIDNFVLGCKADGIWSAIKASCILAGARTRLGALTPLVGTAPTSFNFVDGDYNRKTGLVGNGSTKYLDSNRAGNADPQNNNHVSIYASNAGTPGTFRSLLGTNDDSAAGVGAIVLMYRSDDLVLTRNKSNTGTTGAALATGFLGSSRNISSNYIVRNASANTTVNQESDGQQARNIEVFARPLAARNITTSRLAFYSIGESLDLALLDARVTDLINAFGAAIP